MCRFSCGGPEARDAEGRDLRGGYEAERQRGWWGLGAETEQAEHADPSVAGVCRRAAEAVL
jgi:hypothetical protein